MKGARSRAHKPTSTHHRAPGGGDRIFNHSEGRKSRRQTGQVRGGVSCDGRVRMHPVGGRGVKVIKV